MSNDKAPQNSVEKLARYLVGRQRVKPTLTGGSTAGGRNSDEVMARLLPMPLGDVDDVLTVVDDAGDLIASWEPPTGGGGGGSMVVQEQDVTVVAAATTLDFAGAGFNITDDGGGEARIENAITQYTDEMAQDAVGTILTDSSSVDFTYNDGAPSITATVIDEAIQDIVGAMVVDSSSIDASYNDGANTLSLAVIDESIQDIVGAMVVDSSSIDFTYDDGANTLTAAVISEAIQDLVAAMVIAGTNITITYNDGAGTLTFDVGAVISSGIADFAEAAQDAVGGALVDSASIDFTYNDGANTITAVVIDEAIQDIVGAMATDSSSIDFTYNDGAGTLTAAIIDEAVQDVVGAMATDSSSIDFTYSDAGNTLTAAVIDSYINALINTLIATIDNSDEDTFANPTNWLFRHTYSLGYNTPAGGSINAIGVLGSMTTQGTASAADGTDGMWTSFSQSSTTTLCGKSSTFAGWKADWHITFCVRLKTGADLTSFRYFIGMSEPFGNNQTTDTPIGDGAWFSRSSAVPDTNWQCVSADGTNRTQTDSGVPIVASTVYEFRCHFGTSKAKFYINDNLVATHQTASSQKLPRTNQSLGIIIGGYTLVGSARTLKIGHWMFGTVY